ncbi:DNA glycosylase AlkZ-like family protein [Nocardioides sp. GCM10027113]|uniref:DNA glycosylase AlkZ-like family protein n=1 Tax=unclassified Nocardioides TaxID=2615069 RepID=UPI0036172183
MSEAYRLTRQEARRIAVRAQLLTQPRPTDLLEVLEHLWLLQVEPTAAVAPTADLVLWSRLGAAYDPADLRELLDRQVLVEHDNRIRTLDQLQLLRAEMDAWPGDGIGTGLHEWQVAQQAWVDANDACRRDVLERLRADGPLPQSELPDTCEVPWRSSGWNNRRSLTMLLGLMVARGEVVLVGRQGNEKLWDLAGRVLPDEPYPPADEARRERDARRLQSLGIARARSAKVPGEPNHVGETGETATVEGVKGEWRIHPAYLDDEPFRGRAVLLSPLDRLVFDRRRMAELFEFDYQLEMYKPAAQRRWGYWAMPILYGDRLVGKLDATADRAEGELRVDAIHEDEPFTPGMTAEVDREIEELARWLGLEPHRADQRNS